MTDHEVQIGQRLKELEEQNKQREKEMREAEEAMSSGKYESKPEVEQVKPKPKKKKNKKKDKQTVSVLREETLADKDADLGKPLHQEKKSAAKEKSSPAEKVGQSASRNTLHQSFEQMDQLLGSSEEGKEEPSAPPTGKQGHPKHRGPHTIVSRKVRYIDSSGKSVKQFCIIEEATGEVRPLRDSNVLGKSEQAEISLNNRYVSRRHARIFCEDGRWFIEDLGSTNGTYVNDSKITEVREIEVGDMIELAEYRLSFDVLS